MKKVIFNTFIAMLFYEYTLELEENIQLFKFKAV